MEIKTGNELYFEGCDVIEQSKKNNYDEKTTKMRSSSEKKLWVSAEDILKMLNECFDIYSYREFQEKLEIELSKKRK